MKNSIKLIGVLSCALVFSQAGAADSSDYVQSESQNLRYKEASFYTQKSSKNFIEVGIEGFDKKEQKRILGTKISSYKTYGVSITNGSRYRVHINSIDLLNGSNAVIVDEGLDGVYDKMGIDENGNKENLNSSILRFNFLYKSLQNKIIEPGDTVQGIVFVKEKNMSDNMTLKVEIQNLKKLAYLDIAVPFAK